MDQQLMHTSTVIGPFGTDITSRAASSQLFPLWKRMSLNRKTRSWVQPSTSSGHDILYLARLQFLQRAFFTPIEPAKLLPTPRKPWISRRNIHYTSSSSFAAASSLFSSESAYTRCTILQRTSHTISRTNKGHIGARYGCGNSTGWLSRLDGQN